MVAPGKQPEPRRHHYVPRCWLAGFTETGEPDGQLWVTDLARRKQWVTSPGNAGFVRDFYRLSGENLDPVMAEKALAAIESAVAPLLKTIDQEKREPYGEELDALLFFMALQWARVPAFRPFALKSHDAMFRKNLREALKTKESWEKALIEAGIAFDTPGAQYDRMKASNDDDYGLDAPIDWYVERAFTAALDIMPSLKKRVWRIIVSPSGSFIGCDNPVILEGPKGEQIGFENAEIVSYAVSRHVVMYGTKQRIRPPFPNRKMIANINRLTMLRTEGQVFSHVANFSWLDEGQKHRTDWTLFSHDKY